MFYAIAGRTANRFPRLLDIDVAFAFWAWNSRCPHCGGRLDQAHYPRKPRGADGAQDLPENQVRFSFCCAVEGCRRRLTPFSVRFLGRKVYFGAVVLLVSALRNGPALANARRPWLAAKVSEVFGPHEDTIWRWVTFWREQVVGSVFWRRQVEGAAMFVGWIRRWGTRAFEDLVPWSWLEALGLPVAAVSVTRCLELCAPLTSTSAPGSLAV